MAADGVADAASDAYKHDRRCIIYPSYINSACTVQQGRRVPKDAACDAPNVLEIRDVLEKSMMMPCEVEDKSYSRDFWQRGRVRVTIKKEDGTPIAKEFPTRKAGAEEGGAHLLRIFIFYCRPDIFFFPLHFGAFSFAFMPPEHPTIHARTATDIFLPLEYRPRTPKIPITALRFDAM